MRKVGGGCQKRGEGGDVKRGWGCQGGKIGAEGEIRFPNGSPGKDIHKV